MIVWSAEEIVTVSVELLIADDWWAEIGENLIPSEKGYKPRLFTVAAVSPQQEHN